MTGAMASNPVAAFSSGNWPVYLLAGLLLYNIQGFIRQEIELRQLAKVKLEEKALTPRRSATEAPASYVLDFYIPPKRKTVREALGNPTYMVEPLEGSKYLIQFLGRGRKDSSQPITYKFEFDASRKSILPKNKEALSLLTDPDPKGPGVREARPGAGP